MSLDKENALLGGEEQVVMRLRELYRQYGYACFKMSKFEEYDLYSRHKDFLVSDRVITFNDTDGKLLALKPDVTLSIVKNCAPAPQEVQRLYYHENVYRVSDSTHAYKEIMQTGVECMGALDRYHLLEVLTLAVRSLQAISTDAVLTVSDLTVLSALLTAVPSETAKAALAACIGEKNPHGVAALCAQYVVPPQTASLLQALTDSYGEPAAVCARLRGMTAEPAVLEALQDLETIVTGVAADAAVPVRVDFSLVGDMQYYNGLVFQGFVSGVPTSVLRGGQYDRLMTKMHKDAGAIGFAVYLDLLERLKTPTPYDVDVVLLYSAADDPLAVRRQAAALVAAGKRVSVQTAVPPGLTYRALQRMGGDADV